MITRALQKTIIDELFKGKAVIIMGARQTGKITLMSCQLRGFGLL
jgi:predicted AAA+ superfamily ATPase